MARSKVELPNQLKLDLGDEPRERVEDMNPKKVREALHGVQMGHNSRGRGRSPAEIRESYARYRATKKQAIELERTNKRYLILFPASDKDTNKKDQFYNMGGHSAIIYCHEIGPRIHRKPTLRRDMDNGNDEEKFHSGVCSVADLAKLEEKLKEIGIERDKDQGDLVFFKLHRDYEKSEIREMLKQEQKTLDQLNKVLYSKVLYPDIHRQILELKKLIPAKVKNMDKTYREVVGMELISALMELVKTYSQMAHGDLEEPEAARRMLLELDTLYAGVSMMNELKLWEVSACMRVGDITTGARQLIKGKILSHYEIT